MADIHPLFTQGVGGHAAQAVCPHLADKTAVGAQKSGCAGKNTGRAADCFDHRTLVLYAHPVALRNQIDQKLSQCKDHAAFVVLCAAHVVHRCSHRLYCENR